MTLPFVCYAGTDPAFIAGTCCLIRFLRSCLVKVVSTGSQDPLELLLLQDEQDKTLAPHTAQKPLTDGIGSWFSVFHHHGSSQLLMMKSST
jgi:hypothetical protein